MKLSPIGIAIAAACLMSGCSLLIPSSKKIQTKHDKTGTTVASCDSSKAEALACARFLRDAFAALETSIGRGEAIYGYASVARKRRSRRATSDQTQALRELTNKRNTRAPQAEITAAEGNANDKRVTMMQTLRTQGSSLTPLQKD